MPHPVPTRVDCACGGVLRSASNSLAAKREAARQHNETERHRLWAARGRPGWESARKPSLVSEPGPEQVYEGRLLPTDLSTGRPHPR